MWRRISDDVRKLREATLWNFGSEVSGVERSKLRDFLKKVVALETEALENSVWEDVEWRERPLEVHVDGNEDTPF